MQEQVEVGRRAEALSLLWAFVLGGVLGWVYETLICGPLNGEAINLAHGGLGIPFLQLYGAGAIMMELAFGLHRAQQSPLVQTLCCAALCTAVELATGLFMLRVLGVQTWDYRLPGWDFLASPNGLICLRASLTFGVFGLVQLRWASPAFWRLWSGGEAPRRRLSVAVLGASALVAAAMLNAYLLRIVDVGATFQ